MKKTIKLSVVLSFLAFNSFGQNTFPTTGNAGIGSTNVLEFGAGISGKQTDAGKIGYATFDNVGTGALCIVGAGTTGNNRRIHFWNEGGAVFEGLVTTNGTIRSALDSKWFSGTDGNSQNELFSIKRNLNGVEINTWAYGKSDLILNPNGNVGIGTNAPTSPLHVKGPISTTTRITVEGSNPGGNYISYWNAGGPSVWDWATGILIKDGGFPNGLFLGTDQFNNGVPSLSYQIGTKDNFPLAFRTNAIERIRISTGGWVGIGNNASSPSSLLHLKGTVSTNTRITVEGTNPSGNYISYWNANNSSIYDHVPGVLIKDGGFPNGLFLGTDQFNNGSSSLSYQIGTKDNFPLAFRTNGVERLRISADGKVQIGNTQPTGITDYKLAVSGKVYCQEVNVTPSTAWSDYVFKNDYKLAPLEEVETHIKEKGHLKDVPSAEEVSKNGIKLGEMDATLLRKIEELTLYVIAQQKKINELENKLK